MTAAARVAHLTKTYGSGDALVRALDDVTLDLRRRRVHRRHGAERVGQVHAHALLRGAGHRPTPARSSSATQDLTKLKDKALTRLRRDQIGFVFQSYNLVPTLTAEENILLPLAIAGRKPDREWYDSVIATVQLGDRLHHKPNQLSGGQQQRVAVARALVSRPRDRLRRRAHRQPRLPLRRRGPRRCSARSVDDHRQTIVMVTHDPVAAAYTDRVVFLADGRVVDEMRDPSRDSVLEVMARMTAAVEGA